MKKRQVKLKKTMYEIDIIQSGKVNKKNNKESPSFLQNSFGRRKAILKKHERN